MKDLIYEIASRLKEDKNSIRVQGGEGMMDIKKHGNLKLKAAIDFPVTDFTYGALTIGKKQHKWNYI